MYDYALENSIAYIRMWKIPITMNSNQSITENKFPDNIDLKNISWVFLRNPICFGLENNISIAYDNQVIDYMAIVSSTIHYPTSEKLGLYFTMISI